MTQSVIDRLEAIEIQEKNRQGVWRCRNISERFFKLPLKQQTITKSGQRVVIGEGLRPRLRLLASSNLDLEPLVRVNETTGPLFHPTFQILISLAQLLVRQRDLLFRTLATDLSIDAGKCDSKIVRLSNIVV